LVGIPSTDHQCSLQCVCSWYYNHAGTSFGISNRVGFVEQNDL
jgi:hypothetical protein